ncbi:hypothetical protein F2Q68_00002341 [Brassica cretica]|uniref:Uncharacterized protein n=1 Tax=Brassica cretica TaxID=69181 RepID=A0A8S9JLW7_BRACR|nr:hypothetical protein F2Q68_00002341 [Brassica cretica]
MFTLTSKRVEQTNENREELRELVRAGSDRIVGSLRAVGIVSRIIYRMCYRDRLVVGTSGCEQIV